MYGVPTDLPVDRFVGHECMLVGLGQFQVQLHFPDVGSIYLEGRWELHDADGVEVDREMDHQERVHSRLHVIIGVPVRQSAIDPPRSFTLTFESGHRLTVYDDSKQYESFSIEVDGETTVVV